MFSLLLVLSIFWIETLSLNQICDLIQNQCAPGTVFNCNESECSLFCDGVNACTGIEFNCDDSHLHSICNITCATPNSCADTTIYSNRDTILQCLAYESCIENSTLDVYNTNITADISVHIINHHQNVINENYPTVSCEGQGINYCARHCMGSNQECNTFPTHNPICNFINGNYECAFTMAAPHDDYNEKIIIGQLLAFNDISNYIINQIKIPFTITDTSWNANFISNLEFYIIETDDYIDYQQILTYCNTRDASDYLNIYPSIHTFEDKLTTNNFYTSVSNITFVFDEDQLIIDKTNREHHFAWILLFGCDDDIVYTESMSITTHSAYSGDDYYGHFAGIYSVAEYDGAVELPKGYDYVFEMDGVVTLKEEESYLEQSYFMYVQYIMYGLMALCVLLSVVGYLYSFHSGADNINAFSVILFGIYAWDFYADVVFSIALFVAKERELFLISCIFIVVPFIINFATLFRAHDKWIKDPSIQYRVSEWLVSWNLLLIMLTLISGSAFAAVELVNSNLFPLDMFSMGLTARHIKKFSNKRLYSTVLLENIPQIAIQIYFTFWISFGKISEIAILAFVTSILSIAMSIMDIFWTKRMFKSIKKSLPGGLKQLYYIEIASQEIEQKKKVLLQKPKSIKMVFAEICEIDPRSVNVRVVYAIQGGIRVVFEVHSAIFQQKSSVEMLETLRHSVHFFTALVQSAWKLDETPNIIKIELVGDDEKWKGHRVKNANFSVQAKRASISSERFFSIDLNGVRTTTALNSVQNKEDDGNKGTPISIKDIQMINKEKEAMDQEDGVLSSYWGGSTRHLSVSDMTNQHILSRNIPLKAPVDYLRPTYNQHKKENVNDLSIQVHTPSSFDIRNGEMMYKEPMLPDDTDDSANISNDTETDTDTDSDHEPAPDVDTSAEHPGLYADTSINTIRIIHGEPDRERYNITDSVQCQAGSRRESQSRTLVYNPQPGAQLSPWNSTTNVTSLQLDYKTDILITLSPPIEHDSPSIPSFVNNDTMSVDDQYVKPTLEAMDSYNDTEQELDDIMKNVIVDQTERMETEKEKEKDTEKHRKVKSDPPQRLTPILEDAKKDDYVSKENAEEHDLELNTHVYQPSTGTSVLSDATASDMDLLDAMTLPSINCPPITPPTHQIEPHSPAVTMSIASTNINTAQTVLPPILEDIDNASNLLIHPDISNDDQEDEDELELNSARPSMLNRANTIDTVDTMDTMDMVHAITVSTESVVTDRNVIITDTKPPIIMSPINVTTPVNTEIHTTHDEDGSPSIISMTASSMIQNPATPVYTPIYFANEEKGKISHATPSTLNSIFQNNDGYNQPRTSAEIAATWMKRKSMNTMSTPNHIMDDDDDDIIYDDELDDDDGIIYDDDDVDDVDNGTAYAMISASEDDEDELAQSHPFMRVMTNSEEPDYRDNDNLWPSKQRGTGRPRNKTMPPIHNQRRRPPPVPKHMVPLPPRKISDPHGSRYIPHRFPFKPLPNKPLPQINGHKRKRMQNTKPKHNGITNY